jgi:putative nucleotidyltransferase with HDIG domain
MFESKHSQALWNHSLDVAECAANIASRSGVADREEAFLAGLMHDIGELVILNLPTPSLACRERLTRSGCPGVVVERVILSESHAAIGARLPRKWRFAESIAECVENHHTPERSASPLSSIIYLADLQTEPERELESEWRHQWALKKVGLASDHDRPPPRAHTLSSLRFAAAAWYVVADISAFRPAGPKDRFGPKCAGEDACSTQTQRPCRVGLWPAFCFSQVSSSSAVRELLQAGTSWFSAQSSG